MKSNKLFQYSFTTVMTGALLLVASQAWAQAETRYSLGAKLDFSTWKGDNPGGASFKAGAPMLGLEAKVQHAKWFGGLTLTGGEFTFDTLAPSRPTNPLPAGSEPVTIKRGEVDLVLGYRFWSRISLFLDLKNVSNEWNTDGYKTEYSGLGIGITGFHPLSSQWTLFGNFGFLPMNIRADGQEVGNATRSALNVGFLYRINPWLNLRIGLQSQAQIDKYDSGGEQTHNINALMFGINGSL
jgi:hypothetical protein